MKQFLKHLAFTVVAFGLFFVTLFVWARNKSPITGYSINQSDSDEGSRPMSGVQSELAVVNQSTGSNPDILTRRIIVNDFGMQKITFSVPRSSFITVDYTTTNNLINGIPVTTATFFYVTTGGISSLAYFTQPTIPGISTVTYANNLTVFAVCSASQPCSNLSLTYANAAGVTGGLAMSRVRVYNSRGDTSSITNNIVWDGFMSSTLTQKMDFNIDFDSGITILKQGSPILASWIPPFKGGSGMTR